jgi:TPR repeat protein
MEYVINNILIQNKHVFVKISNYDSLVKIHKLLTNNKKFIPSDNLDYEIECLYLAFYYKVIEVDHELMKKYYCLAVEKGNTNAMVSLGYSYYFYRNNMELAHKYYLMAAIKGNFTGYHLSAAYYKIIGNVVSMKQYYHMGIERGCNKCSNSLGNYYRYIEKDEYLMEKYYKMSIENGKGNGKSDSMDELCDYYYRNKKFNILLILCLNNENLADRNATVDAFNEVAKNKMLNSDLLEKLIDYEFDENDELCDEIKYIFNKQYIHYYLQLGCSDIDSKMNILCEDIISHTICNYGRG